MEPEKVIYVASIIVSAMVFILSSILLVYGLLGITTIIVQIVYHKPINISVTEFAGIVFIFVLLISRFFVDYDEDC